MLRGFQLRASGKVLSSSAACVPIYIKTWQGVGAAVVDLWECLARVQPGTLKMAEQKENRGP